MILLSTRNLNLLQKLLVWQLSRERSFKTCFLQILHLVIGSLESSSFSISFPNVLATPSINFLKLNFDAAAYVNSKLDTTSAVVRDHQGSILDWCCHPWVSFLNTLQLESIAYRETLLLAKNRGFSKIILRYSPLYQSYPCRLPFPWDAWFVLRFISGF